MRSPYKTTLLDVVHTVSTFAASDDEVVALVTYLVNSGKIRLCGTFAGARIDLDASSPYVGKRPSLINSLPQPQALHKP